MNDSVKAELDRIVSTLTGTGIVSKVILFGSCARGEETANSDIDLCVLTPEKDDGDGQRLTDITIDLRVKLIDVRERPLDLITYNQDDFSNRVAGSRSFQRHIIEHGVVLFGGENIKGVYDSQGRYSNQRTRSRKVIEAV
ncbi:hypothetical protein R80B4_00899 [Fibrobacteres bacterium R8-0-B4]